MTPRRRRRLGYLLFSVPVVILLVVIADGAFQAVYVEKGTVVVRAFTSGTYYSPVPLQASVSVGGVRGTTPINYTLQPGGYTVSFGAIPWFTAPPSSSIIVRAGATTYATGVYDPIVESIAVDGASFNVTSLAAYHGVTPVVWVNTSGGYVLLVSQQASGAVISPHGNYTKVFSQPGTYIYFVSQHNSTVTITVY